MLAGRHLHAASAPPAPAIRGRGARHDHVVDIAALGGSERQRKILAIPCAGGDLLLVADVGPEDDLDRALRAPSRRICAVGQA
jgi:hypothetical protein